MKVKTKKRCQRILKRYKHTDAIVKEFFGRTIRAQLRVR